ncbi:MAG TPA: TIGR03067 domain-containing protein [Gemmataceae bacterium]|nr:TIGR03067 domain-containing protein [Gemmataceae bacterium]
MNRISGINILSAAMCLAYLSGTARADDPPAKGPAGLQGCWKLVSVETDGKTNDPVGGGQPRWVVKGDTVYYGGEAIIRFTADPSTTPLIIDLRFRDPDRVYEGVYAVEKDTLKVCLNSRADAKDRPGEFATKDRADRRLLVFEREKAAPENPAEGATAYAGIQLRADEET